MSTLFIQRLSPHARIPSRATSNSVGYDLSACESLIIPSGKHMLVNTGITIGLPKDCYGRVAPRSGLAVKHGIQVGAGVIDPDYTGEVKVVLFNLGEKDFEISIGDRIAQLILETCETPPVIEMDVAWRKNGTERGSSGFGSSGK